jgi:prepilin-type processing-associated H-X9-DG protein
MGGIWDNRGGLVAFFDGHVEWFDDIIGRFKKYGSPTETTTNLCKTLPDGDKGGMVDSCFLNWQGNGSNGGLHN